MKQSSPSEQAPNANANANANSQHDDQRALENSKHEEISPSLFAGTAWQEASKQLAAVTKQDVQKALSRAGQRRIEDFLALLSPVAKPFLETMATLSRDITRQRFGNTMRFFTPLYLSNECHNECTYCGFSVSNAIKRLTLTKAEALREIAFLKKQGFCHVLLLTGESPHRVGIEYIEAMLILFKQHFSEVSIEMQPLESDEYHRLHSQGLDGVTVFQETYHVKNYAKYHKKGLKQNYGYRLATAQRAAQAGMAKIGLGALLGLSPWRLDSYFTAMHALELEKRYWRTQISISFPRLRPAEGLALEAHKASKDQLFPDEADIAQLIFAYRIFHNDLSLVLSSRERPLFRNNLCTLGITSMSAASSTNPGGYVCYPDSLEQFSVNDKRSLSEVTSAIGKKGMSPVMKDWMPEFA